MSQGSTRDPFLPPVVFILHDENSSIVKLVAAQVAYTGVSGALVSPGRVEDTDGGKCGSSMWYSCACVTEGVFVCVNGYVCEWWRPWRWVGGLIYRDRFGRKGLLHHGAGNG